MTQSPTDSEQTTGYEVDISDPNVASFKERSTEKIQAELETWYGSYGRDTMRIMTTLATLVGRDIEVRPDNSARLPYATLDHGALTLHGKEFEAADREKYKAIIEALIKPELVALVKELDLVVQEQLVAEAQSRIRDLEAARQKLTGVEFDPMDSRLLAVQGEEPIGDSSSRFGDRAKDLLDNVFA